MSNIIKVNGGLYELYFRYHPTLLAAVKELPGRRYVHEKKYWTVPVMYSTEVEKFAKRFDIEIQGAGGSVENECPFDFSDISYPELEDPAIDFDFRRTPFPFQRSGVGYILDKKKVIVGDQMGLGKTGQSIMAIAQAQSFPCLVICPATLRENWRREWTIWTNRRAVILNDDIRYRWPFMHERGMADVFIVNYESLSKYFVTQRKASERLTLKDITFHENISKIKSVIIDEAHRCKNTKTLQSKLVKGIAAGKEYILALTGTPIINKPDDMIAPLAIIEQLQEFGGYKYFKAKYCDKQYPGALEHLNAALRRTCFYRREKHEVLTDLPAKTRQIVYCEIDNRKEYAAAEQDLADYLKEWRKKSDEEVETSLRGEIMVKMGALKNISARGKLATVFEYIDDLMESGEKLVVFAHLKEVIDKVVLRYPHAVTVTGQDDQEDRNRNVDKFQNDPNCKLIVCSIQAAGVGITLTAASRVAFIEFAWHPAIHDQAEDRCHRIGQQDNVQCTYFAGRDTIDEYIYSIIEEKRDMSNRAVGAIDQTNVSVVDDVLTLFDLKSQNKQSQNNSYESQSTTLF